MWELDYKESWAPKNWCFWTVGEDSWESLGLLVLPKGNQCWIFFGRTNAEAETPILWPPDVKSWLIWKAPDAGKDWGQDRGWDGWMASPTQWTWVWVNSGMDREAWRAAVHGVAKSRTPLSNWTEPILKLNLKEKKKKKTLLESSIIF